MPRIPDNCLICAGEPRAPNRVHPNTVERGLRFFFTFTVNHRLRAERIHHRVTDLVTRSCPDIDDFVVLLTLGHQARSKLAFDLSNFILRSIDDVGFFSGDNEIFHADRRAERVEY